jgi:PAS domain S-box-containing protein
VTLFGGLVGNLNRQRASRTAGFAAVTIAAATLISWWVSLPLPSSFGSGFATVKPTTALCLAALGLAVVYPGTSSRFVFAVGLAVAAVAALDLLDLFSIDSGINRLNRLLVPQAAVPEPETSFRMINGAPPTLALLGGSLALGCFERHRFAATALSGMAGVMAIYALLNYISGVHMLLIETPTPLTAIGLLCVSGAIILQIATKPALRKPRPLWHLLIVLGCAVIVPLLLFGVYTGLRITDGQLSDARNDLMSKAGELSADVDREIVGEIERLHALAASGSLRQGDFAEFQRQAEASLALRQSGDITLVDRDMQELVNTRLSFGRRLPKTAVPESVETVLATGKPQVTGLFMGLVAKQLMYAIIVPVQIDGENRYALVRSPDQHALAPVVAANKLAPGRQAVVSDATHRIIVQSDQQGVLIGRKLPRAQRRRAGADGEFEFIDSEGRPSVEAYAWSELTGWKSAVWAPRAMLEAPVRTLWWTIVFMGGLALTLVVGLASWLGRIIARSVDDAARAAIALGEGVSLPLSGSPVAEVDTLMAELQRTAIKRRAAEDLVRQSESIFRAMFEVSSVGKIEVKPESGRFLRANAAMCKFVGYTEEELLARTVFDITHPDDRDHAYELLRRMIAGESAVSDLEKRCIRKDGNTVWARVTANVVRDGLGRPLRNIAVILDVTEHKEREEKVHLLMREVNHRAKNMLSVVDAIAHQTATKNPEDFIERFSERIQALSANQDLLVRNEWNGVEIENLVCAQLAHFADLIGSRIAVHGPKLRLRAAAAQAIGLALHELATNAGKYGALSTEKGRVDVLWAIDGDTCAVSWTERDGPPVSAPDRGGFGTIVMKTMTERSVNGAVQLDYPPSGLMWRLTCPAANALESGWDNKQILCSSGN